MISLARILVASLILLFATGCQPPIQHFDVVIKNARVMDPETGLDAIRDIGISGKEIAAISEQSLGGDREIDATGLVAAPGFIDVHAHGQDLYSARLQVRDGVTSRLDLEGGALPITKYYSDREGGWPVNYGASASHIYARMQVLDGVIQNGDDLASLLLKVAKTGHQWARVNASEEQLQEIFRLVEEALADGALGVGIPVGYYSHVEGREIAELAALAAKYEVFVTTHLRYMSLAQPSGFLGLQEFISLAVAYNVPLLVHHITSTQIAQTEESLRLIALARANGVDVMAEVYPFTVASSIIGAAYMSEGFRERLDIDYADITWVETGERLTEETFQKYRNEKPTGLFLMNHIKREDMIRAMQDENVFIGSDGVAFTDGDGVIVPVDAADGVGRGHPRGAASYAKVLRLVREENILPLMDALEKMSLLPARFLETADPSMKKRGRIQVGAFADITLFDPETVQDNASFEPGHNSLPSGGIPYVLVNGEVVVGNGSLVESVSPGMAIRGVSGKLKMPE
jgi:hypothetical protein